MKTFKTTEGNLSIVFSKEETDNLINLFSAQKVIEFDVKNPYKYLRGSSMSFIRDLKEKFGNSKIYRHDDYLIFLERKYFVKDIAQLIRRLQERGFCEVYKKETSNPIGKRIDYFILTF